MPIVVLPVAMETVPLAVAMASMVLQAPICVPQLAVALATRVLPVLPRAQALTGIALARAGYGTASGHRCARTSPRPDKDWPVQLLASLEWDSCSTAALSSRMVVSGPSAARNGWLPPNQSYQQRHPCT